MADNEMAEAFAGAMGIEANAPEPQMTDDVKSFLNPTQAEAPAETQTFVHEPTGKEFNTESELDKYNSGWAVDHYGKKNKELQEQLQALQGQVKEVAERPAPQQQLNQKEIVQNLFGIDAELADDPTVQLMYKGLENTANLIQSQADQKYQELKGQFDTLAASLGEQQVRAQLGVDSAVEQKMLEKHPSLKAMPFQDRMAVIKEMAAAGNESSRKPASLPTARAADHVEGSAVSTPPEESAYDDKFDKMSSDEQLAAFSQLVKKQGHFGNINRFD